MTTTPLQGIRVVDFTHILAGPFCTQLLADAGATVVKVEPPGGEWARRRGPKRIGPSGQQVSSYFAAVNRGKHDIVLDLKNPSGRDIAHSLIAQSDVVVENFSPKTMERLGLDLSKIRESHPRLITVSISLFGGGDVAGQLAGRGGLAVVAEAESSLMSQHRGSDGRPITTPYGLGDMTSGLAAYAAIASALFEREQSGLGQHLDISMVRATLALNAISITGEQIAPAAHFRRPDTRTAGMGLFPTSDGFVAIGVNSDVLFARLAQAIDRPDLATDPRFAGHEQRDLHVDTINGFVTDWTSGRSATEAIDALAAASVPCGRVNTPRDILGSPIAQRLELFATVADGFGGTIYSPGNPFGFGTGSANLPNAGEDTEAVIHQLYPNDEDAFDVLREKGAFGPI